MFNAALIGLLAGSLSLGTPDGGDDKKTPHADKPAPDAAAEVAGPSVFASAPTAPATRAITSDTYALGFPSDMVPLRVWASYGWGEAQTTWNRSGENSEITVAGSRGDIVSQRVNVGAQINPINFSAFKIGAGAQLTVAKNEFQVGGEAGDSGPFSNGVGDLESDFEPQNVKVFGVARGRVLGVHGGYIFDVGSDREFGNQATVAVNGAQVPVFINASGQTSVGTQPAGFQALLLPTTVSSSDGRDAIFVGADFDYPSDRFRLFGGIDYFMLQGVEDDENTAFDESSLDEDGLLNFLFGAGLKFSIFEVGAALQIQSRLDNPTVLDIGLAPGIGGHAGTIAPYLRISPPQIPASLFVKGAVQDEYTEYGYAIGGANSITPELGFTAGLSIGFE